MELKWGKYEDKSEHETRNQNPNKHRRQMKKTWRLQDNDDNTPALFRATQIFESQ